jgi:hypothetical protein
MLEHLMPHHASMPPPTTAGARDRPRPRTERVPLATTVVGSVILATLVIVLALAAIATMPGVLVAPTAILFIGGLIAASLALRTRASLTRRAYQEGRRKSVHRPTREEAR